MGQLIFDKYEIRKRLAIGGMGEVFYAVQTQRGIRGFERPVILKSMLPDLAAQPEFVEQFLDEARVAATLNHPNVISIYEVGLWDGAYYIAMEFIDGQNLSQLQKASWKKKVPVPPAVVATIVRDAALGLQHAHEATDGKGVPLKIVHRDISPQNIMVRQDGVTKVVDFGIARAANRSTRTATGSVKGKLAYMAPEQLRGEPLTGKADQFALGLVLWELLTGKRLFSGEAEHELMAKVLSAPIPHPSTVSASVPRELGDVAMKMLERDVGSRFASMGEVCRALTGYLSGVSSTVSESPVKGFVARLSQETGGPALTDRATPSSSNFVIDLAGGMETEQSRTHKPRVVPIAIGAAVLLIAAGMGVGLLTRARTAEVPVAPEPRVEAPTPPEPPPPEPAPTPAPAPTPTPTPPPVVAEPKEAPAPGRLKLVTEPPGATVRFDGRPFTTPVTLEGAAGSHVFLIEKPGHKREEFELDFKAGVEDEKKVVLQRLAAATPRPPPEVAAPAPKGPGFLSINTEPWSRVMLNGAVLDSTPIYQREVPSGRQTLTLINEEKGIRTTRVVEITPGKTTKVFYELK